MLPHPHAILISRASDPLWRHPSSLAFSLTFGDTIFAYQTSLDTYWNGNMVDIFFSLSGFFFAMGIYSMPTLLNSQDKTLS
jgi:hypothetical protein